VNTVPYVISPPVETSDGVEIATYDLGGAGPTVILAHATGFHGRVWLPVAAALSEHYHCWAFDSRGHGESGRAPGGDYRWEGFALDVLAVVEALRRGGEHGAAPPLAVGHSCGGAALLLAEEAEPGTFAALYCYEPVVPVIDGQPAAEPTGNPLAAGARRRREIFASRAAALDNYAAKPPFSSFDPAALDAYVEWGFVDLPDGTVQLRCRREDEARVYEAAWHHQAFQQLDRVACPVALAAGGPSAHFGLDVVTAVAERIPRHQPVEIHEHLGHFGPMEAPVEVAASVHAAFNTMENA
jgi:pimeloyl-ACP methyl ester carboxylesterase